MNDRNKELIIKSNIVISATFGLFAVLGLPVIAIFINEKYETILYNIWVADLIAFLITGLILMILLPIFGLKQKPVKAEKIIVKFNNFDEVLAHFKYTTNIHGYQLIEKSILNEETWIYIFIRKKILKLESVVLIETTELTAEILDSANQKFNQVIESYYITSNIDDSISMISLVCVDRITSEFQKYVNSNIQQSLKGYKLPVGLSFGGKGIYIAKQKDGFAIMQYKKLRKEFLNLLSDNQ